MKKASTGYSRRRRASPVDRERDAKKISTGHPRRRRRDPVDNLTMTGKELRAAILAFSWTIGEAAPALALSPSGLQHQLRGVRPVSRQTALLIRMYQIHGFNFFFDEDPDGPISVVTYAKTDSEIAQLEKEQPVSRPPRPRPRPCIVPLRLVTPRE